MILVERREEQAEKEFRISGFEFSSLEYFPKESILIRLAPYRAVVRSIAIVRASSFVTVTKSPFVQRFEKISLE